MQDAPSKSIIEVKNTFERESMRHNVQIKRYHADNGSFADTSFKQDCDNKLQQLTFCGVGAHHQNGIAERSIKELTLCATYDATSRSSTLAGIFYCYVLALCFVGFCGSDKQFEN